MGDLVRKELSVEELLSHVQLIEKIKKEVMKEGEHYGLVPGCGTKPCLLQPGAEILIMTFGLVPETKLEYLEMENGHREYRAETKIYTRSGELLGNCVGNCSTMESKYRYRWENTGREVPKEYWDTRNHDLLGGDFYVPRKTHNDQGKQVWMIYQKVEHPDPADYYNTCAKIARKRSLVGAVTTITAASNTFTVDLDDMAPETIQGKVESPKKNTSEMVKQNTTESATAKQKTYIPELLERNVPKAEQKEVIEHLGIRFDATYNVINTKAECSRIIEELKQYKSVKPIENASDMFGEEERS